MPVLPAKNGERVVLFVFGKFIRVRSCLYVSVTFSNRFNPLLLMNIWLTSKGLIFCMSLLDLGQVTFNHSMDEATPFTTILHSTMSHKGRYT